MSQTIRVADYLMAALAEHGAEHVFLLPGGGAMHLNDALVCEKRLVPVPCHHEQACGIAAEAWGRVRETFGVCMVTTGPGATNVITPVAGAWIESVPMMVISGQAKRADRLAGRPLRQGGVQEVDIVPMVRSVTKYAVTVDDPQQIRYHFERALHAMRSGRAGPVWLDIPLDVQAAPIDPDTLPGFPLPPRPAPDLAGPCARIAELLADAERPLLLAGHGVRLAGAARDFARLAEDLQIPVTTTWNALDLLPWEHPLNVGRPGVVALRAANFAVQNCDLLISIGCRLDNIITAYNPRGFARAAKKAVIDIDRNEIDKLDMAIDIGLEADARDFIAALSANRPAAGQRDRAAWIACCADWKRRYPVNDGASFPNAGPIDHYHFVSALSDAAPPDTMIATGSSGLAVEVFYTVFRNKPGQRVFLTSGLGSMGYGLPAAIGACLGNGGRPMIAVESDGSLQLNLQELATLAAHRLPITLIVMNNGGYASIRNTQRNYFAGRHVGTGPEAGLLLPPLDKLAATYGLPHLRIADAGELPRLGERLDRPGPCLIEIVLTPEETLRPKVAALPQADGGMLSMPLEDLSPLLPLQTLENEMRVPLLPASRQARAGGERQP
ncbi:thiamine pyrophosphate-binding protein [Pseudothauera nasutitermitis]|uniref:Thiamine pyrophosphate-binding protein n=1 Tax=Pseudothauera nasutitermitis TaxID=2565930 RepID=A0A4S4AZR1_9RHOO|nr:thiamine pyrophosphate-binding protein [Pseudothauera nasutitermitis]THF65678.1 thiamine pyrophosphate-binding protein [Pseudothauera nasutitermitis]